MARKKNRAYCDRCIQADNYIHTPLGSYEHKVMRLPRPVAYCRGETSRGHRCLSVKTA